MRRTSAILLLGLAGCVLGFVVFYFAGTASSREMMRDPHPELVWLKREFKLGNADYNRIVNLHQAYLPQCAERCRMIEEQTAKLRQLMAQSSKVTPEIQAVIAERARMYADCEAEMLKHFITVSRTMPPDQGRRYLEWVERQTFMRGESMQQQHKPGSHQH